MRQERGYDYEDTCTVCPEKLPNYEEKIKSFYEEHIHSDEVNNHTYTYIAIGIYAGRPLARHSFFPGSHTMSHTHIPIP